MGKKNRKELMGHANVSFTYLHNQNIYFITETAEQSFLPSFLTSFLTYLLFLFFIPLSFFNSSYLPFPVLFLLFFPPVIIFAFSYFNLLL